MRILATVLTIMLCGGVLAQDKSGDKPPDKAQDKPTKAPKPKSRLTLLRQMQTDLDAATPRATVDGKGKKKIDKCHEILIDAIAQQQRYKSVNSGRVNGCLNDLEKLDDAGSFAEADRDKLRKDRESLGDSIGKQRRFHLPKV